MACQQPAQEKVPSSAAVAESCMPSVARVWMAGIILISEVTWIGEARVE
jgi:hypothetical protein